MEAIGERIAARAMAEHMQVARLIEWQTQTLASYIAATVPMPEGSENPLLAAAAKIALYPAKDESELQDAYQDPRLAEIDPDTGKPYGEAGVITYAGQTGSAKAPVRDADGSEGPAGTPAHPTGSKSKSGPEASGTTGNPPGSYESFIRGFRV